MEKKISPKGEHNKLNYDDRIKNYVDFSEQRFEEYCQKHKFFYRKLHLNQSDDIFTCPIPHWGKLGLLTSMPDFFVYNKMTRTPKQLLIREITSDINSVSESMMEKEFLLEWALKYVPNKELTRISNNLKTSITEEESSRESA
jgi:hypothetical protein